MLCGRVKLKTPLFPMHCFALRESEKFRLRFEFNPLDYRHCLTPGESDRVAFDELGLNRSRVWGEQLSLNFPIADGRFGFMLYIGIAQIHPAVSVRFWGPCPTASVTLNEKEVKSVTDVSLSVLHLRTDIVPPSSNLIDISRRGSFCLNWASDYSREKMKSSSAALKTR